MTGQPVESGRNGSRPAPRPGSGRSAAQPRRIEKAHNARRSLARFLPYLRPYQAAIAGTFLIILAYTVLDLLGPYLMGVGIDRFIATKNASGLVHIAILMLVVYLGDSILQTIAGLVMAGISQRALQQVRQELFDHLQKLSLRFYDHNPAGELMSRLTNDIDAINQAVSQNGTALLSGVLTLIGILVAMFVLNHWLALASLFVVPLTFWFTSFVARYTRRGFRRLQKELGNLNGTMEETISGQRVVKAFLRNDWATASFQRDNEAVYQAGVYANSYALLLMPLTNILGNLFVIVLAGLGGWLAIQGLATVGTIATFISYGRRFTQPLRQLANIYNDIQAALAGAERVFEIIDTPPETEDAPDADPLESIFGEVRFDHVNFGYLPGVPVIRDMSLTAHAGQAIALVGPTGAGKSTIFRLITGEEEPDAGEISCARKTVIGYFSQDVGEMAGRSALEEVMAASARTVELGEQIRVMEAAMCEPMGDDALAALLERYGDAQEEFEHRGGYDLESRAQAVLTGLGIGPDAHVASLFPGLPALYEEDRTVVAVRGAPQPPPARPRRPLDLRADERHRPDVFRPRQGKRPDRHDRRADPRHLRARLCRRTRPPGGDLRKVGSDQSVVGLISELSGLGEVEPFLCWYGGLPG